MTSMLSQHLQLTDGLDPMSLRLETAYESSRDLVENTGSDSAGLGWPLQASRCC